MKAKEIKEMTNDELVAKLESLKEEFDGVLTLTFDENARKINFFYKLESDGLRLEDAQRAQFKDSLVVDRSSNPVVMFFAK